MHKRLAFNCNRFLLESTQRLHVEARQASDRFYDIRHFAVSSIMEPIEQNQTQSYSIQFDFVRNLPLDA